jgi:hypothetical protein
MEDNAMKSISATRRGLLLGTTAAMAASGIPKFIAGSAIAQGTIPKRRNIESLSAAELQAYEHAIKIVKDRSTANPDDPDGYQFWASYHDNFDESIHSGCTHSSEKFFPWHRRYLADFEAFLQKTDPPVTANVMVPYWDWTHAPTVGKHFPQAFERTASPLFDVRLGITPPPWDPADILNLIQEPDWGIFAGKPDPSNGFGGNPGSVESGPHNTLHVNISRHMRNPDTAVQDPIFWSFHAGIDLVWARWQRLHVPAGQAQSFADPEAIIFFRDRSFTVSSTARTADFNYEYDYDFSPDGPPAPVAPVAVAGLAADRMITAPTKRSVKLDMAGGKADEITAQLPAGGTPPTSGVLRLGDVRVFHDKSYRLNLYLHPKDTNLASLDPKARGNLLLRTVTLWRAHHDGKVEVFVRPTAAQLANLTKGWIITVQSEAVESDTETPPGAAHMAMPSTTTIPLPATSHLLQTLEFQER